MKREGEEAIIFTIYTHMENKTVRCYMVMAHEVISNENSVVMVRVDDCLLIGRSRHRMDQRASWSGVVVEWQPSEQQSKL